ncbi:MAG: permease [Acidimicrobiales bacterium]
MVDDMDATPGPEKPAPDAPRSGQPPSGAKESSPQPPGAQPPASEPAASGRDLGDTMRKAGTQAKKWGIVALVLLVVGIIAAALIPRWWAQRVGDAVGGSIATGSLAGILLGFVCTAVPLVILAIGLRRRRHILWFLIGAVVIAMPNLATAWVAFGAGSGAKAGRSILDVNGPGFRGGSLVGALFGLASFGGIEYLLWSRRRAQRAAAASADTHQPTTEED